VSAHYLSDSTPHRFRVIKRRFLSGLPTRLSGAFVSSRPHRPTAENVSRRARHQARPWDNLLRRNAFRISTTWIHRVKPFHRQTPVRRHTTFPSQLALPLSMIRVISLHRRPLFGHRLAYTVLSIQCQAATLSVTPAQHSATHGSIGLLPELQSSFQPSPCLPCPIGTSITWPIQSPTLPESAHATNAHGLVSAGILQSPDRLTQAVVLLTGDSATEHPFPPPSASVLPHGFTSPV
jgi:hypothetical protein